MIPGTRPRFWLMASCMLSMMCVAGWHAVRIATSSPAPTVKIRWRETVSDSERRGLERRFQLVNAEEIAAGSYNYDLIDSRADVIKAIVEHPAVEDTADLDPRRFTVATTTEPGDTMRWLWHRTGRNETARTVSIALHGWLLASLALAGLSRYTASGVATKRMSTQTLPK